MLKVSALYLEKQKSCIPKKNIFEAVVNIKTNKIKKINPGLAYKDYKFGL